MNFVKPPKEIPQGTGRVASHLRSLQKSIKRLTPTGAGISHGPLGTSYIMPKRRGGGSSTATAPSWV